MGLHRLASVAGNGGRSGNPDDSGRAGRFAFVPAHAGLGVHSGSAISALAEPRKRGEHADSGSHVAVWRMVFPDEPEATDFLGLRAAYLLHERAHRGRSDCGAMGVGAAAENELKG